MQNYRYQMQVYASLFKKKNGEYPSRAVLYFLAEDNPEDARVEIPFDADRIEEAMETFRRTVSDIEESRDREVWPAPDEKPSKETCDACDIRWDCPLEGMIIHSERRESFPGQSTVNGSVIPASSNASLRSRQAGHSPHGLPSTSL